MTENGVADFLNVIVVGASQFPQNAGMNPTGTVGALAYLASHDLVGEYLKVPGESIGSA